MKFRKKPMVIEVEQFTAENQYAKGVCRLSCPGFDGDDEPHVHTMKGQLCNVSYGDWIIPRSDGEHFYPCNDAVFTSIYEPVADETDNV